MMLEEFVNKNKELANQYLKCGSCGNSLQECGKYEIVKIGGMGRGKKSEEGLLCETCKQNGRQLVNVTKISDDNNHIFNYAISQIEAPVAAAPKKQQQEQEEPEPEEQVIEETIEQDEEDQEQEEE